MTAAPATDRARPTSAVGDPWTRANQLAVLAALGEVTDALARHAGAELPLRPREAAAPEAPSALDVVADAFGLSPFERAVLLLCAGVELDAGHAALCGGAPTFGLALA